MSDQPHESFQDALDELRRAQLQLKQLREKLQQKAVKVTSKDGMITVTLDERGEISAIGFSTAKFRRMAPAELGAALVDAISQARAQGRERLINAYRPFLPKELDLDAILAGKFSPDRIFDDARRQSEISLTPTATARGN